MASHSLPPGGEPPLGSLTSHYDYDLPPERIARYPAERRDHSRLLVVPRAGPGEGAADERRQGLDPGGRHRHLRFHQIDTLLRPDDVLVVNESRVIPARLLGRKPTGADAEILLIQPWSGPAPDLAGTAPSPADPSKPEGRHQEVWEALVRPGGKLKPGRVVEIAPGFRVRILDSTPDGGRVVRLESDAPVARALEAHGHMPLPPYIDRPDEPSDRDRYQTVYARTEGSVAAPTAGLHFTDELLDRLALGGVEVVPITLHVGVGTFRPVEVEDPTAHDMHEEFYQVTREAAERINAARNRGGRIWAVGTTVVRTLETVVGEDGRIRPGHGQTHLFIRPPHHFRAVDALITNFHLPRSTLMMLVAAFAGYDRIMDAYREALAGDYRFYSYGDAMAIL